MIDELLYSNITISAGATLRMVSGSNVGNVDNAGVVELSGCGVWDYGSCGGIAGNYIQGATATWRHQLGAQGSGARQVAHITGTATLGGTVEFYQTANYFTGTAYVEHILHADGGVSGQFDRWIAPGLFVTGALRYAARDVYFDLTRVSVQAAMASSGIGTSLALASAGNVDRAFQSADQFALMPRDSLTSAQLQFLRSAASIQQIDNFGQAVAVLDSLSGHRLADGVQQFALQHALPSSATGWRLDRLQPGSSASHWAALDKQGLTAGLDQWLGPRMVVGSRVTRGDGQSGAAAYLRGFGEHGWYAGGELGFARHTLALGRVIDLGPGGLWGARSHRSIDVTIARLEGGRSLSFGGGTFAGFAALDGVSLLGDGTLEQGQTGFELALQPNWEARLFGGAGIRYNRDWRVGERGWMRLEVGTGYLQPLGHAGEPLRAAFIGIPDMWFDVPAPRDAGVGWQALSLRAGSGAGWIWSVDYHRQWQAAPSRPDWWVGVHRSF